MMRIFTQIVLVHLLLGGCGGSGRHEQRAAPAPSERAPVEATQAEGPAAPTGEAVEPGADEPALVELPARRAAVVAGASHSCVLVGSGEVSCWGSNRFAQLGDPTLEHGPGARRESPGAVAGLTDVRTITAGTWHTCVAQGDGTIRCWGHGGFGQLGAVGVQDPATPVAIEALGPAKRLAAGERHTCALGVDGRVSCWGQNDLGQLGDGTTEGRTEPALVPDLQDIVDLRAGRFHTCAQASDGRAWCWGMNVDGQLADGGRSLPLGYRATPALIRDAGTVLWLRAGGAQTCVQSAERRLRCWGRNDSAQLGSGRGGSPEDVSLSGDEVAGAGAAENLALGSRHSCVSRRGEVRCVGYNRSGQLGEGSNRMHRRPARVSGLQDIVDIAAGVHHSCALSSAGRVWCWGRNEEGQLGDGTTDGHRRPVAVPVASPALADPPVT